MKRSEEEMKRLKEKYQNVPVYALVSKTKKKSSPTNQLTSDIMEYVKSIGSFCIRCNSQGTYSEALGKYIYSGSTKGQADLLICHSGRLIACELKIGRDKQNAHQIKFQQMITQAGGYYFICGSMESFKEQYHSIVNQFKQQ